MSAQQQQVSTLRKSLQQLAPATKVSFARLRRALQGRRWQRRELHRFLQDMGAVYQRSAGRSSFWRSFLYHSSSPSLNYLSAGFSGLRASSSLRWFSGLRASSSQRWFRGITASSSLRWFMGLTAWRCQLPAEQPEAFCRRTFLLAKLDWV